LDEVAANRETWRFPYATKSNQKGKALSASVFFGKLGQHGSQSIHPRHVPGRARPPHRAGFKMGHAKCGGRKKGTPNAISPRARKAIAAAAKRIARGIHLNRYHWWRLIDHNPLITEALEHQGQFTLAGAPRQAAHLT
jgi:hypothetical protein